MHRIKCGRQAYPDVAVNWEPQPHDEITAKAWATFPCPIGVTSPPVLLLDVVRYLRREEGEIQRGFGVRERERERRLRRDDLRDKFDVGAYGEPMKARV